MSNQQKDMQALVRETIQKVIRDNSEKADVLGFRLLEDSFLVPARDVQKVIPIPETTLLPGAKPWVVGVTKDREGILPIIDMGMFAYGASASKGRNGAGVLLVRSVGGRVGLLVTELVGLKRLADKVKAQPAKDVVAKVQPYVICQCVLDDEKWTVLDLVRTVNSEEFQNINLE